MAQITTTAATTPPTIAPIFKKLEDEEADGDGVGEFERETNEVLRLARDEKDCDAVVDAFTMFAAARSVSVRPLVPHAMCS